MAPLSFLLLLLSYSLGYSWLANQPVFIPRPLNWITNFLKAALPFLLVSPFLNLQSTVLVSGICLALTLLRGFTSAIHQPAHPSVFFGLHLLGGAALALTYSALNSVPANLIRAGFFYATGVSFLWQQHFFKAIIVHLIGILWIFRGGSLFVHAVLGAYALPATGVTSVQLRRGKLIGNLERALIYFLVQTGLPGLIAAVLGIKVVARFRRLEEPAFAENFLIGTLASLLFALAVAFAAKHFSAF